MGAGLVPAPRSGRLAFLDKPEASLMKVTVVAQKSTRHSGKLYRKGESFDVPPRTARIYGALGRARLAAEAELGDPLPARPPREQTQAAAAVPARTSEPDPLAGLRAEYQALIGETPDRRWGEARLRNAIRDHKDAAIASSPTGPESDEPGDLL
jgi:hypothetical protein